MTKRSSSPSPICGSYRRPCRCSASACAWRRLLRAVGDARRAMNVTLFAGLATAVLDPILIFGFGLDLVGAAIAALLSRCVLVYIGWGGRCGSTTWWLGRRRHPDARRAGAVQRRRPRHPDEHRDPRGLGLRHILHGQIRRSGGGRPRDRRPDRAGGLRRHLRADRSGRADLRPESGRPKVSTAYPKPCAPPCS